LQEGGAGAWLKKPRFFQPGTGTTFLQKPELASEKSRFLRPKKAKIGNQKDAQQKILKKYLTRNRFLVIFLVAIRLF